MVPRPRRGSALVISLSNKCRGRAGDEEGEAEEHSKLSLSAHKRPRAMSPYGLHNRSVLFNGHEGREGDADEEINGILYRI